MDGLVRYYNRKTELCQKNANHNLNLNNTVDFRILDTSRQKEAGVSRRIVTRKSLKKADSHYCNFPAGYARTAIAVK